MGRNCADVIPVGYKAYVSLFGRVPLSIGPKSAHFQIKKTLHFSLVFDWLDTLINEL